MRDSTHVYGGRAARAALVCLGWALLLCPACAAGRPAAQSEAADAEAERVVEGIDQIAGLSVKQGEPEWDEHAAAIVELGERAAPYLVKKLTDTSVSKVGEGFQYKIGDVALALLHDIYGPKGWPFPDDSEKLPQRYGDFRDYVEFVNSKGARARLQKSWREYIKKHRPAKSHQKEGEAPPRT